MHQWRFFQAGGFDQVSLTRGEDFAHLAGLDQKLWAALACPVSGLEFDGATLALIDADGDGRVRASELLGAIEWTLARLATADELLAASGELPLAAIAQATEAGAAIAVAARTVLHDAGRDGDTAIDLAAAEAAADRLAARALNGDGVVSVDSTDDAALQAQIQLIVDGGHGATGRDGKPGVSMEGVEAAQAAAAQALAWLREAEAEPAALLPAGAQTPAAWAAVEAVRTKVEDFFARCRLAAFDARAEAALNREEGAWLALAAQDLSVSSDEIRGFPLARVAAGAPLPLAGAVNPAWADALAGLQGAAVRPLLGQRAELRAEDWTALLAKLQPYAEWQARKPAGSLVDADAAQLAALARPETRAALEALIAADKALEPAFTSLGDLVKLIRFRRDLAALTRNFVNFGDFYDQERLAVFQCGTLYLDQRSCTLCLTVNDAGKHATLAGMAGAYLAYCDCVRKATGETMHIVAAFTGGDSDNLMVGRNGIFYDRKGRDWDATITRIVDNPISVRQAFWSPYKKLVRFVEEQVVKRAAAADAAASSRMQGAVTEAAAAPPSAPAAAPAKKIDVGTVAALGVALGSLGTAFGFFMNTVAGVKNWQMPLLVLGLMLLISGPSMIMAFLKLRRRNIAPLLDANGWAVNARALISVPFGARLTGVAVLPPGAGSVATDRFAGRSNGLLRVALLLFVLWWLYAFLSDTGLLAALWPR